VSEQNGVLCYSVDPQLQLVLQGADGQRRLDAALDRRVRRAAVHPEQEVPPLRSPGPDRKHRRADVAGEAGETRDQVKIKKNVHLFRYSTLNQPCNIQLQHK